MSTQYNSWELRTLGDCLRIKHGFAFKGKYFAKEGQYVVLTPRNFHESGGFKKDGKEKFYAGPVPDGYVLSQDDLIVG